MLSDLHLKVNEPVDSRGAGCRRRGLWTSSVYIFAFLFVFVAFFSVSPSHALAAERYWVGGSGNWSDDDTHWATTSGGAPADGNVPTSADNAHFNADSNTTAYTVTVDATANMLDLMFDAAPSVSGTITWAGSSSMTISGSFLGLSGMTRTYTGDLIFNSTSSGKTITMNGVTTTTSQYSFNGVGGVWTLQDTVNLNSGTLILTNGTLDTNGKTVSANYFQSTSGTRTLTLGASAINLSYASAGAWNVTSSLTLTANTATITLSGTSGGFTGGGLTYGSVVFTGTTQTISDANTFTNLTRTGGANYTSTLVLSANQTITGTFTATGNSAVNRLLIKSDTAGTARTITAAAVSLTDVDFTDITGAGAATWTGTRLGNAAGNSGITFTDAANKYYVGNTANWNGTVWALTSGGEAGANNFPLPQDTAKLDANSFSADSQTLTINGAFRLPSIVAAGTDQTYTLATGSNAPTLYGTAYTLDSNTTISGTSALTFSGRNTQTVTSAGKSWSQNFIFDSIGGSFVLADDLSLSGLAYLYLQNGNLNLSGHTLTGRYFGSSNANVRSITSGGGVIVVNGEGTTVWTTSNATNFTLNDALQVNCTGATGTNRVYHGDTAGTEANVPSFAFTGAATVRINDNGGSDYKSLDFTGFTGELKNAGNGFPVTVYGNLTLAAAQTIEAGTDKFIFAATSGTQIITSNTKTLDFPITINAAGATVQLADNLTMGSTRTLTLTAGTLDLNGKTLSTGLFSSSNSNTRSITSGGGGNTLTGTNETIWDTDTSTNLTLNDTLQVDSTYSGGTGTRLFKGGSTGAAVANSPNFKVSAGTDAVDTWSNSKYGNFDFTGFVGTLLNNTRTIYGNLTISTGLSVSAGTGITTLAATSGTQSITTNGKTLDFPITINAPGATVQLADNLTMGSTRTLTLTNGTLNLNGKTLSTGLFSSSNSNTRSITSGGGGITLTGSGVRIFEINDASVITLSDTLNITSNYSGSTGTRQFYTNISATNAAKINLAITAGTDTADVLNQWGSLNLTGFAGTFMNRATSYFGNITFPSGVTYSAGSSAVTLAATSGTQVLTTNAAGTLDFPITVNAPGATVQLADNLTMGSTRTLTLTAGTLDLNGKTLTTGLLSSTNTNTRGIKSSTSGGKIIANSTSATATINFSTATNFTIDRSTAPWTIEVGGDTTNVRTINTGGLTLPALTFTNATASGELDISHNAPGTGTFKSISVSTPPQTLKFTSGTNTTIEDTTTGFPSGTSGSLVTVGTISGTATLTKSGGGRVCSDYLAFSNITGSPATTAWYVGSGSSGSGTGLIFSACPDVPATNPVVPHATAGMLTASGGTLSTIVEKGVTYRVHTFTTAGTSAFKVTGGSGNVQYLVVGGGGGGGSGGGGAGGFRANSAYNYAVSNGSYTVTVGGGGAAAANGSNSVFDTITAAGGGAGASTGTGTSGGSGGGGGSDASTSGGAGTPGQGNSGGAGVTNFGGGGGGASAAGDAGTTQGGNGGAGTASVVSGTSVTYAGGGGGAGSTPGAAGAGGGGAGSATTGADGTAATGGGGGGGVSAGGSGGSGIVIIRYPISTVTIKPSCNPTTVIGQDGRTYGTVLAADGNCWLDRNLGAPQVATASGNGTGYGDLYQWGRLYDGHQATTSAVTFTGSAGDVPGNASFIATTTSPYDWRNQRNNNLWQGVNGTNNVCPTGFRLPTQPEWSALVTAEGITNAATAFSSSLKLPVAGYRGRANGSLYDQGSGGYYWSSGVSGTFASHLFFNAIGVFPANADYRAVGFSVRCVRNQKAAKVTVNASRNTTLTNGLVGLWSFDGADVAGTTAYDRSGSGNNGTLTGGVSKVIGKLGQALKFDGSTGSIRITNGYTNTISGDDTHTVSLWLKGNSFSNQPVIITADSISNLFFLETNNTGTGLFWGYGGAHRTYSSSNVSNGWHQIVMVKTGTGNSGNLYVDGVLQTSYTGSFTSISTNTLDMLIADYLSPGFEFNGSVDEVRIYNRALTSAEIKLLYTSGK